MEQDKGSIGAVLMNLSKTFDTISHELLIAKLCTSYRFFSVQIDFQLHTWQIIGRSEAELINCLVPGLHCYRSCHTGTCSLAFKASHVQY